MKSRIVFLTIVLFSALISCGQSFDAGAEQETLESIWKELIAHTANPNMEVFDKYVDQDFEMYIARLDWYGTGGRSWMFTDWGEGTTVTTNALNWIVTPEMAVAQSDITIDIPGEKGVDFFVTDVFEKKDGQWVLVRRHQSEVPFRVD